jgi:hypothetical protein
MQFGFFNYGYKDTQNGKEIVLLKQMNNLTGGILKDYPIVDMNIGNSYLLSIYPKYHTRLFSDSILKNEKIDILKDRSYTNSIHKIYLTKMNGVGNLQYGDKLLIYRTSDIEGKAYFRSVVTSICVVEELKNINEFNAYDDFVKYCEPYSIFDDSELRFFYRTKEYPYIIKMTYNIAFSRRITRGELIEKIGFDANDYWGFFQFSNETLKTIAKMGGIDESFIVN